MDVVTVGDLLEEFLERERKQLEDALVVHGPTIGDMYEGLTGDVLGKALPQGLDLRVVSGFVTHNGVDSAQQDCMVVVGDGQPIPYVPDTWRYPPNQVLMIVEVKTSAHRAEVLEARNKYESVVSLYEAWIEEGGDPPVPWAAIEHAFAEVTGRVVRHGRLGDAPEVDQAVFTTITKRFMYPLFVLFGHDGFVSELGLRNSLAEWLVEGGVNAGIGVTDWPALLVSGGYSLVMAAGTTWAGPLDENSRWTFMMSSREPPMHLLIEMLWTRLGLLTGALPPWGEDLHAERLSPFLFCRPVQDDDGPLRWQLGVHELREDQLEELAARDGRWMPVELTQTEWIAMSRLAGDVVIDVADEGFRRWTESRGVDPEELVQGLVATRLAAREGDRLVPVARRLRTSVLPDGRRVAADDNTGRLGRWIAAEFPNDDLD